jgi:hypothetical protein
MKVEPGLTLTFKTKLECIASGMNYFAVSVPRKITTTLGSIGPVPVKATVNDSLPFIGSLYPVGEGQHYLRIKNAICKTVGIKVGDSVQIQIIVRDRSEEVKIPKDLSKSLQASGALASFTSLPLGKRSFLIRKIEEAKKDETRQKRIQEAVNAALEK